MHSMVLCSATGQEGQDMDLKHYCETNPDDYTLDGPPGPWAAIQDPAQLEQEPLFLAFLDGLGFSDERGDNWDAHVLDEEYCVYLDVPVGSVVVIHYSDSGFVSGGTCSPEELEAFKASLETDRLVALADCLEDCLKVDVYQERGETTVTLRAVSPDESLDLIVAHWPDCAELFEDGFLDARDAVLGKFHGRTPALLRSATEYARDLGLLDVARRAILAGEKGPRRD